MEALADVPWLGLKQQIVRDRAALRKALKEVASQLPPVKQKRIIEVDSYKELRSRQIVKAELKLLEETLGEEGWEFWVQEEGYSVTGRDILIRFKDGKAAVVGGPLKENQVFPHNRIPEDLDRSLDQAEVFELYSLNSFKPGEGFHGFSVLGKKEIKSDKDRKKLLEVLRLGVEDNYGFVSPCFSPRHGIRLKKGAETIDLVICFQCSSVQVFKNDKKDQGFLISDGPQKTFNAVLKAAGVKLPTPPMKLGPDGKPVPDTSP
jgi:hypothetical protein